MAKVTKGSFRAWEGANIFQPLGMKQTHFCDDTTLRIGAVRQQIQSEAKAE